MCHFAIILLMMAIRVSLCIGFGRNMVRYDAKLLILGIKFPNHSEIVDLMADHSSESQISFIFILNKYKQYYRQLFQ